MKSSTFDEISESHHRLFTIFCGFWTCISKFKLYKQSSRQTSVSWAYFAKQIPNEDDVCIWEWWHQVILFPGCLEESLISHHCCSHKDLHLDGLPRIWLEAQLISHQTLVHIHQVITYPPWTVLCWSCPTRTSWHQKALNSVSTFSLGSIHFTYFYLKTLFWRNKSPYLICKPLVLQDRYDLWITLSWVACVLLVHY